MAATKKKTVRKKRKHKVGSAAHMAYVRSFRKKKTTKRKKRTAGATKPRKTVAKPRKTVPRKRKSIRKKTVRVTISKPKPKRKVTRKRRVTVTVAKRKPTRRRKRTSIGATPTGGQFMAAHRAIVK